MKVPPTLIIRRPGTQAVSGNKQSPSPDLFHLESGVELLFLDIGGGEKTQKGFAIKKQVRQNKGDSFGQTLEKAIKSLVFTHQPEMVFILTEGDDRTQWDESLEQILRNAVHGLPVYAGLTAFPLASQVSLGDFENGQALAAHLADGQTMPGVLDFRVGPNMDARFIEEHLSPLFENGLSMIHLEMAGPESKLPKELLWAVSKQGIWNHVSGNHLFDSDSPDASWILNTPNIVHSFEDVDAVSPDAGVTPSRSLLSYGKLPGLPGRPLWQVIRNPLLLLPWLGQMPQKQVLRMRVDEASGAIFGIGTGITYFFEKPDQIPGDLMDEIIDMVDAGGSVDITHVRDNLKKAYLIGYAMENGCVIGNSSLKHPRQVFIDRLKGMTGLDFSHCVERGYTSVRPEYRAMGIGAKLLEGLTQRAVDVKVFSIISEDNLATQKIAIRNNTRKITTYFSDKLKKEMGVWMPEHMITKEWESGK